MQIIDLFSGIGGFSYAGHSLGWSTVQMVEFNPFCQRVLKHHFPEAAIHSDIKTFNIDELRKSKWNPNQPSIITGGFPCQPYSAAGKRKGKEDERHLWPEMLRVIREVHPRWVVGENVLGIISWNGGLVFDEVQADLEAEGYEVWAYVLPACGVDAPHQRFRVWFVAYSKSTGTWTNEPWLRGVSDRRSEWTENAASSSDTESGRTGGLRDETETPRSFQSDQLSGGKCRVSSENGNAPNTNVGGGQEHRFPARRQVPQNGADGSGATADSYDERLQGRKKVRNSATIGAQPNEQPSRLFLPNWQNFPTQPPIRSGDDGLPEGLVDITFSNWRNNAIKALGNSIVPQVALQIFKSIEEYEHNIHLYS